MRLKDKVAVVTGAGSGIGRAAALRFAAEGARVVVSDVNAEAGSAVVEEVVAAGGRAILIPADVSNNEDVRRLFAAAVEAFDGVHVLYNNAGVFFKEDGPVVDLAEATWNRILAINLTGTFLCCKYGIPAIIASGGGSVINTSSSAGVIGVPGCDAYTATKGAIIALTRSLAVEYAPRKVRVNCLVPCAIDTPMNRRSAGENPNFDEQKFFAVAPTRRYGTPEEVANLALFLASDEAAYAIGGIFVLDGGLTIMNRSY
jgi:NAD(P)-dependent dehydrogenase (short-subunit alcohol dehydrogenase family)